MFLEVKNNKVNHLGWIEVIAGSMFSGKTEELLRRLRRARIARLNVEIFKPVVDNRYSESSVVSHDANTIQCTAVENSGSIMLLSSNTDVVGIDEAQFFDHGLVDVCNKLASRGLRVIVAGLDMDFRGEPFGPVPSIMACAEYVTKVHAICVRCGNLALYSYRLMPSSKLVEVGAHGSYEAVCRSCYNRLNENVSKVL